jgi:hypothetical protein
MAATAKAVQLTVTNRFGPFENGRSLYVGTAEGGTEYVTGGVPVEEEPTNSRFKMPSKWDQLAIGQKLPNEWFASSQLLRIYAVAASEVALAQIAAAKTMASAIPAGTPFWGIGLN